MQHSRGRSECELHCLSGGCKNETHGQAIKNVVSFNENLRIKSQRYCELVGHFRTCMVMEREGRLVVGAGDGRGTSRKRAGAQGEWERQEVCAGYF